MKILMISMNSIHFIRWVDQLKDSGHEIYWFDIRGGKKVENLSWVHQIVNWKLKFNYPFRYFIKKNYPRIYLFINKYIGVRPDNVFEKVLLKVQPDVVHSFALYVSCSPIYKVMIKYSQLPWIYSSWGSDLYYFKNIPAYKRDILNVLPRINYLITDCKRDIIIAKDLGFEGRVLGTFPGGGGFEYRETDKYIKPVYKRSTILVKGYQGRSGRAIEVIKGLELIKDELKANQIIVFGADKEVEDYITEKGVSDKMQIKVLSRNDFLPHGAILKLMGKALIYIGNSDSDGMPNTLLEAIAQGAFPIQSNPGGASSEVITHGENGFLIENCNDLEEITQLISNAISDSELIEKAFQINQNNIKPLFERTLVKKEVLNAYNEVLKMLI